MRAAVPSRPRARGDQPANAGVTGFGDGVLGYGVVGQGTGVGVFGQMEGFSGDAAVMGSGGRGFGVIGTSTDSAGCVWPRH